MSTTRRPLHVPLAIDRPAEADYSAPAEGDHDTLARDRIAVGSLAEADLDDMVRIDRRLTGHDRADYITRKVREALTDSGLRVSLTARVDEAVVGFVMVRLDYGEFGHTDPVAIMDTIGVHPGYAGRGVGKALFSQLFVNLSALAVERVETTVSSDDFGLLRFLDHCGFKPAQRLAFRKRLA